MDTTLASTLAERLQALQQLEISFGQPNGNMLFTFDGSLYQAVGVNSDGTLQAMNVTTGQLNSSLDPASVYEAVRAASGNPISAPPAPPSLPSASAAAAMFTGVTSQIGMYTGFVNTAAQIPKIKNFIKSIPGFGPVMGSLGALLSTFSVFQGIQDMYKNGVTGKGVLSIGMSAFGIATGVNMALLATLPTVYGSLGVWGNTFLNPAGWGIAAAVISASVLYGSINSMLRNGVTPEKVVTAAIATLGVAVGTNLAIAAIGTTISTIAAGGATPSLGSLFTTALFTGPWGWVAAGAMVLFSILWSLFHQPPVEQVAAQNLSGALSPIIWTPGPLTLVGVGTVALLMGWGNTKTPPAMASLTVPAYYVNQILASKGIGNVPLNSKTPSVIVEPGDGKVVIVSPNGTDSKGNPLVTLQSFNVDKTFQFVSSPKAPPQGSYIPFFRVVNGKLDKNPNPEVVHALTIQDKMLQAVLSGTLSTQDAMNALNVALAANKPGVTPAY